MNVSVDGFRVQLAWISANVDGSAHDVQVETAGDITDIDVCRGSFDPEAYSRRHPQLEPAWLGIPIVCRLDEHLGACITSTHEEGVARTQRSSHENGILVPAVHRHTADHVDDAQRALHPERQLALNFLLSDRLRGEQHNRDRSSYERPR